MKRPKNTTERPRASLRKFVGKRLRAARRQKRLTQAQAGEMLGYCWNSISRFETGQTSISLDHLEMFAEAYGRSVGWLLGFDASQGVA